MYKHVSINEVTLLKDLDPRTDINKKGKYQYFINNDYSSKSV
jgi:hypothetical protein